ncbi:hypothetical protein [Oceanimonas smirnovii]|uniref:hypothetical protein n=1 Tax=Oceanimonas smirnovii TaxID=264574 RepID=UPI0012EAB677|nr:hypothetical protein [Oceanimonas smirnovii]
MDRELLTLPKAQINIVAFGEDDELQISLRGVGSIFTWPQFCTLYPPGKTIAHHRLHVESPDSRVVFTMDINDATEAELLTGLLAELNETQ